MKYWLGPEVLWARWYTWWGKIDPHSLVGHLWSRWEGGTLANQMNHPDRTVGDFASSSEVMRHSGQGGEDIFILMGSRGTAGTPEGQAKALERCSREPVQGKEGGWVARGSPAPSGVDGGTVEAT